MIAASRWVPFIYGLTALVVLNTLWIVVLVDATGAMPIRDALIVAPAIAGFLTTFFAPNQKLILGTLQGTTSTVIALATMQIFTWLGFRHDSIGGVLETFVLLWLWSTALAFAGSVAALIAQNLIKILGKSSKQIWTRDD